MDNEILRLAAPFIVGLLGVAVGYGGLRIQVRTNRRDIKKLREDFNKVTGNPTGEPAYVRREECVHRTAEINSLRGEVQKQGKQIAGVRSFARWFLTTKEKMSLSEANAILGED